MQWKQPEGIRRHWILEELDGELLFVQNPQGAAQGRFGDEVYDLRDGGVLRKKRTLSIDGTLVAELEEKAAGAGGTLRYAGAEYTWKPANLLATRWSLLSASGQPLFTYVAKPGLAMVARIELPDPPPDNLGPLLLLCWYVTVL